MKFLVKINARKIGSVLAVLFIVGLTIITIYSRSYAERQKPLVQIALPESSTLHWSYEVRSTIRPADEEEKEKGGGTEWVTEVTVPYEAYNEHMGELTGTSATLTTDGGILPKSAQNLFRTNMENGDVCMVLGYELGGAQPRNGEGVIVNIEYKSTTEFGNLVPPEAIWKHDYTGEQYIYVVNSHDGAWGREYFVQMAQVTIGLPTNVGGFVNVTNPILQNQPFVIFTEEKLHDGMAVRVFD